MTQDQKELKDRIVYLRGKMSQHEFARRLEINPNTLRNYENGRAIPNQLFLARVCNELNVNAEWILLGKGPTYNNQLEVGSDEYKEALVLRIKTLEREYGKIEKAYAQLNNFSKDVQDKTIQRIGRAFRVINAIIDMNGGTEKSRFAQKEIFKAALLDETNLLLIDETANNLLTIVNDELRKEEIETFRKIAIDAIKKDTHIR